MTDESKSATSFKNQVAATAAGITFILQLYVFAYSYNFTGIEIVRWFGWLLLIPSFLLITLSITAFMKYGAIEEGKSWVYTTDFVQKGIYEIIRHPFSVGWTMFVIALAFISQHWLCIYFMGLQIPFITLVILSEEELNLEKFGSDYRTYQAKVPMVNPFTGIIRYLKNKRTVLLEAG